MNIAQKLAQDKFTVDEGNPHIVLDVSRLDAATVHALTVVCPAGLYTLNADQQLQFDSAGCLECGTCRVVSAGCSGGVSWKHPRPSFGVSYRFG